MRVLFSGTPLHGHILPMIPLARALRERGADIAMLTAAHGTPLLEPDAISVLAAGPNERELNAEVLRTTGLHTHQGVTPALEAEFFAGARIDLGYKDSLDLARDWGPDLVVCELWDFVGPMVAATLGVPTAVVGIGPAPSALSVEEIQRRVAPRYSAAGIEQRRHLWYLDTCPPTLQRDDWVRPAGWHGLRPEAHRSAGWQSSPGLPSGDRPRVLVSFGTLFSSPSVIDPLIEELLTLNIDLRVTLGLTAQVSDYKNGGPRVEFAPFRPLAELLSGAEAVVTHGGSGTVLGTLAAGLPMVVMPLGADQPMNAQRVADMGAGISFPLGEASPQAITHALVKILGDQQYRAAAQEVADGIRLTPSPHEVASMLAEAIRAS